MYYIYIIKKAFFGMSNVTDKWRIKYYAMKLLLEECFIQGVSFVGHFHTRCILSSVIFIQDVSFRQSFRWLWKSPCPDDVRDRM